jgi:hypothetical protein
MKEPVEVTTRDGRGRASVFRPVQTMLALFDSVLKR